MIPSQKKRICEVISELEFDWLDFSTEDIEDKADLIGSKLLHIPTDLYFEFYYNKNFEGLEVGPWRVYHSPGENYKPRDSHPAFNHTWEHVIKLLKAWLKLLKNEIDSQSFIDKMFAYQISGKENLNNGGLFDQPFSEDDSQIIRMQLNAFKTEMVDIENYGAEIAQINQKIDYLIDRLDKKYPKIDWINIFVSTVFQLLVSEGLEIAKSSVFIERVKLLFHLITGGKFLN